MIKNKQKIPILVIVGPTASGKTALSIEIAKKYGGEIVSADSMQIYKGMDIATAKPSLDEMCGIPHHLMSFLEQTEQFSVSNYVDLASSVIFNINERGRLPIVVGGTGLYITSLIDNIKFTQIKTDYDLRELLLKQVHKSGGEALLNELAQFDPEYAKTLHPNNLTRIIRGIEIYKTTGIAMSQHLKNSRLQPSPYESCIIGLGYKNRQILYDRINKRVDIMLQNGLLKEAENFLKSKGAKTSAQAIGYKELEQYFKGNLSLEQSVDIIKQQSRRYAKRQLTWFRRDDRINWVYVDECENFLEVFSKCGKIIENKMNLC